MKTYFSIAYKKFNSISILPIHNLGDSEKNRSALKSLSRYLKEY